MARRPSFDFLQDQTWRQLQTLPGIGPATARAMVQAGVTSLDDLSRRDPVQLHAAVLNLGHNAPGLVHVLAKAVHRARTGSCPLWWDFPLDGRAGAAHRIL